MRFILGLLAAGATFLMGLMVFMGVRHWLVLQVAKGALPPIVSGLIIVGMAIVLFVTTVSVFKAVNKKKK
jgi:apolipoprotein N-acyltransferase